MAEEDGRFCPSIRPKYRLAQDKISLFEACGLPVSNTYGILSKMSESFDQETYEETVAKPVKEYMRLEAVLGVGL